MFPALAIDSLPHKNGSPAAETTPVAEPRNRRDENSLRSNSFSSLRDEGEKFVPLLPVPHPAARFSVNGGEWIGILVISGWYVEVYARRRSVLDMRSHAGAWERSMIFSLGNGDDGIRCALPILPRLMPTGSLSPARLELITSPRS
jgi:hypothetical protein